MILRRTSAAGTPLLGLLAAKDHLRVTDDAEDALIVGLIAAATGVVGEWSGRVMSLETWKMMDYSFSGMVKLPKSPVIALTAIGYIDATGTAQAAAISDFNTYLSDDWTYLEPKAGASWPQAGATRLDGVSLTFTVGYAALPAELHTAILLLVGHYYTNREAVGAALVELPLAVESLVSMYKIGWASA